MERIFNCTLIKLKQKEIKKRLEHKIIQNCWNPGGIMFIYQKNSHIYVFSNKSGKLFAPFSPFFLICAEVFAKY